MGRQEGKGGAVVGEGVGGEEVGGVGGEGGFHEERDRRKKVGSDVVRFPNQKHMRRQIRWGCGRQEGSKMEHERDEIPVYVGGERVKDKKGERGGGGVG